jgi:serine/threonine protein kinase
MEGLPPAPLSPGGLQSRDPQKGPPSHRDDILIADYTLIRRIGSGAYGEVWLAQSVTGAYRAVKIVWREDFELTRTFHREFLGIQQFEPISRGHPCLVHILHVGWNEKRGFYYCVMELADDAVAGANFGDMRTYVPRTLGTDMKRHGRLDLVFCRDAGVYLADALHYMHNRGLTHRDIKPSNIIFVGGVCKLADIGLVAALGERTFVGTEGFVPPEGPGTPQADLYSLGKVLYEMSSGKDRMEFPEVPSDLNDEEWLFWTELNRVICKACAPDLKERFATAAEFAEALQKVGGTRQESFWRQFCRAAVYLLFGSLLLGSLLSASRVQRDWSYELPLPRKPAPAPVQPLPGKPWRNVDGQWFSFVKERHLADVPVEMGSFRAFLEATLRAAAFDVVPFVATDKKAYNCVLIPPSDADAYCAWMTSRDRSAGRLDQDSEYVWRRFPPAMPKGSNSTGDRIAIRTEIARVAYGHVVLDSTPPGAEVLSQGQVLGHTPLKLAKVRASSFRFEVTMPGYREELISGSLREGQSLEFNLRLRATGAVVFEKPWVNSLGLKLVPLGKAMLAATETRRGDYHQFLLSTGGKPPAGVEMEKSSSLPMVAVSRVEAEAFCRWLTERERAKGLLEPNQSYRLPSDDEWSMAVYLPRELGQSAKARSGAIGGFYPWGFTPLPPAKTGNFADRTYAQKGNRSIAGYHDAYAGPAPVGSFSPDPRTGVHDLSGNVWEWVADPYEASPSLGVVRGGAFTTSEPRELLASYRRPLPQASREADVGFRILLAHDGEAARRDDP